MRTREKPEQLADEQDNRTWLDQPKELIGWPILASMDKKLRDKDGDWTNYQIEVRMAPSKGYYITFGTLFMSQTVHVPDGDKAFETIQHATKSDAPKRPPAGCVLLKNDELEKNTK